MDDDDDNIIAALPPSVQCDLVALKLAAHSEGRIFYAVVTWLGDDIEPWPADSLGRAFARTLALFLLEDLRRVAGHLRLPALRTALARSIRRSRAGALDPRMGAAYPAACGSSPSAP